MNNLSIWEKVQETDPKFTKADYGGFTSINGVYLYRKATEIFGAIGFGWGFEILEERYDEGIPFLVKDIGQVTSKTHTLKIELWFMQDGKKGKVINFGHTKYIYKTKNGYMIDDEAPKKSLTDAIKKCLSMLGFSADIFMGQFEDRDYVEKLRLKSEIENADDKDAARLRQIEEHREWLDKAIKDYDLIDEWKPLKSIHMMHLKKCNRRNDQDGQGRFIEAYNKRKAELEK